jgi:hypothetical protein
MRSFFSRAGYRPLAGQNPTPLNGEKRVGNAASRQALGLRCNGPPGGLGVEDIIAAKFEGGSSFRVRQQSSSKVTSIVQYRFFGAQWARIAARRAFGWGGTESGLDAFGGPFLSMRQRATADLSSRDGARGARPASTARADGSSDAMAGVRLCGAGNRRSKPRQRRTASRSRAGFI